MFKKSKIFLAIALVLLMSFTSITAVLATNLNGDNALIATNENSPVQAAITKHLRMPIGTPTPNITFTFNVQKISVDDRTTQEDLATMPDLLPNPLTISFTAADTPNTTDELSDPARTVSVRKETDNIFQGVTFPHAGIYVYKITENRPAGTTLEGVFEDGNELWYYSRASYELIVHVANRSQGGTFVRALGTRRITSDPGQPEGIKVDPTPGGYEEEYFFSQMEFRNDYIKTDAPDIPNPVTASTLFVSKTVGGDMGDKTRHFNFLMTLTAPEIIQTAETPPYYRAFVIENGSIIDPVHNAEASLIGGTETKYIRVPANGSAAFTLTHGQRLSFADLPIGTRYTVVETVAPGYDTGIRVITPGGATPDELVPGVNSGNQNVGQATSRAEFTNTRDGVTPTGLNLNDLPFIGLIVLALGALTIFVVLKVRKRNYD